MTDYTKLVEALRRCQFGHGMCAECPYYGHKGKWNGEDLSDCDDKMHRDAADAIEALQAENTDIREELFVSQRKYDNFVAVASMENAMLAKQIPKRGEIVRCGECKWWEKRDDSPYGYCHACKHGHYSEHWEIGIYRLYKADWFCADGEREVQE